MQEDELSNDAEDELEESHDMIEDGLFGQGEELGEGEEARDGKTRALPKGPWAERVGLTSGEKWMKLEKYLQCASITAS